MNMLHKSRGKINTNSEEECLLFFPKYLVQDNLLWDIFNHWKYELACLYESTESDCCHFDVSVGMGLGVTF